MLIDVLYEASRRDKYHAYVENLDPLLVVNLIEKIITNTTPPKGFNFL